MDDDSMSPTRFDPFNCRLARDIRNHLSKAFLQGLIAGDSTFYQERAVKYLRLDLDPVYENYVRNRLEKYDLVFAEISRAEPTEFLQQVSIFWDHGLYFEMHELLEPAWMEASGEKRRGLQGLIRAAGAMVHADNNNQKGVVSMAAKALADLEAGGGALAGSGWRAIAAEIKKFLAGSGIRPDNSE